MSYNISNMSGLPVFYITSERKDAVGRNRSQHPTFDVFLLQIEQLYCLHQLSLPRHECIGCYFGGETMQNDLSKQGLCPFTR